MVAEAVASGGYGTDSSPLAIIYYNIYNMPWSRWLYGTGRWWLLPDEVAGSSRFVVETGVDVYWLLRDFVVNGSPNVDILGVDASAGYGKSLAAIKLAVDLSYDGWLVIIAFHSHVLGRRLMEYVLRYAFVRSNLTGKWWEKLVRVGPLALPRIVYVSGMEHYCPFYTLVPDSVDDEKLRYVVEHMLSKAGVPRSMWGKPVKYLIEHKILNAKLFCEHCPFMRKNGRLRLVPREYWPDKASWLGPRILYTRDVADIVEKYLFPLLHDYDYRRKSWRGAWLKKYVKVLDPRAGICPRRLLLKPIFSKRYKRKSDGKVVFYNFWLYHGSLVILAPYELALKIARIAYHVRGGRKILLIIDEADALFFKRGYVPVFDPGEFRKELELFKVYVDFFRWLIRDNVRVVSEDDFGYVFGVFKKVVGRVVKKSKFFMRELLSFVLSNRDRLRRCFEDIYRFLYRAARDYYGRDVRSVDEVFDDRFLGWLAEELSKLVSRVSRVDEFYSGLEYLKDVSYESIRLWNILYVLSMSSQSRVVVRELDEYESLGRFRYGLARAFIAKVDRKISPLYSLRLLRGAVSLVLRDGILYYEYYPYLEEVFEISKSIRVVLLSATLATYYLSMRSWFDVFSSRYGVSYQIRSLLSVDDVFDKFMRRRIKVVVDDSLRDVRVHKYLRFLPSYVLRRFILRFDKGAAGLVEFVKGRSGVVIVTQNKVSAEYLVKVFASALREGFEKLDSGYYFGRRLLITWLRSRLNRGVNVHDVDPTFVPRWFIFAGTFLSSVRRAKIYEYGEPPSGVVFSLDWIKGYYFSIEYVDEVYGVEVLCWIEQFVGRALRVGRSFGVCVYVALPGSVLEFGLSVYLLSVSALPDYGELVEALDRAVLEYYRYRELAERSSERLREIYMKRAERWLDLSSDPVLLLESSVPLLDRYCLYPPIFVRRYAPWLWSQYVNKVKMMFGTDTPVSIGI